MRILRKTAALVSVKEDIVNVQRGSHEGLVVSNGCRNGRSNVVLARRRIFSSIVAAERSNCPQALINRANIKVDFHFVILYITFTLPFGIFKYFIRE